MRILVTGATGLIGNAVAETLEDGHEVIRASREADPSVDLTDRESIVSLYKSLGTVDAVVCCAGKVPFKPLAELTEDDFRAALNDKVMGQVNLVSAGLDHVADGGSFTLITGVLAQNPIATGTAASLANGAIESYVRAAATELPRGLRINAVSPTVLEEATGYHPFFPGFPQVPAADVAAAFVRSVMGVETGRIFRV
ncbi:short chain dehydrogenase [Zafaria cholistanensis]|uniref:Short chain dehydrogenase n=1 Tax=Zafaria cholistanensis TaxID=1682741 RepID=A0A5A7NSI7_9MICC|nr:short chain dehydrogenase [Zafaria cholistanensis]GER23740.1 short chain dehydrogenase [Zafaria cholistanensis]